MPLLQEITLHLATVLLVPWWLIPRQFAIALVVIPKGSKAKKATSDLASEQ
jgi:hypothetical protein